MQLEFQIPHALTEVEFENIQNILPYVDVRIIQFHVHKSKNSISINLSNNFPPEDVDKIKSKILAQLETFRIGEMTSQNEILFDHRSVKLRSQGDVLPLLISNRDIFQHAPGVYSLHGKVKKMFDQLEQNLVLLSKSQNADEVLYPVSISLDTLKKSDFFSHFPHFASFITTLFENSEQISEFSKVIQSEKHFDFLKFIHAPKLMCRSAGCLHSYPTFENKIIKAGQNFCQTMVGRIFRNESKNISGLERLNEYHMREIIYFGTAEYVKNRLQESVSWFQNFMQKFQIHGIIQTANDPFFADNLAVLQFFQHSEQSKLEARFTNPANGKTISVGSVNFHGSHFSKAFQIRFEDGTFINTGCVGFGFERLIFAIFAQFGYYESEWPSDLREFFALST